MKKGIYILIFMGIVCVSILLLKILAVTGIFSLFMREPPPPEIKYGEFPFTLKYELDGEQKIIEDVIICEFCGYVAQGTAGKYRQWKTRLKSGNENITLLDLRQDKEINEFNQRILELYFSYGSGAYYMGDEGNPFFRTEQTFDWIDFKYVTAEGKVGSSSYKAEDAYVKYKIKIVSWDAAPPLKNTFE